MGARVASYILNDLPAEVLSHVISFLPIKEAVRTSVLSRRWRYHFTFMTNLDFEVLGYDEDKGKLGRFLDFLDRLVLLPSILRFRLCSYDSINPQRFYKWICALVPSKIQELDLLAHYGVFIRNDTGLLLPLPESLFSCENLVVLKLNVRASESFELKVPNRICLPHLKVLHLVAIGLPNDGSEESLFSSCHVLEDLVLIDCSFSQGCLKFKISSQSLKKLTLISITSKGEATVPILVDAPNMVFLSYFISNKHSLKLIDAKSLAKADIDSLLSGPIFVTAAPAALSQIQNIQKLSTDIRLITVLQHFNVPIPLFDKVNYLKIWHWEHCFADLRPDYFLARGVVLETLVS